MDRTKQGPAGKDNRRQLLIRIDEGLIRRIKILAIDAHISASVVVERAIVAYFAAAPGGSSPPDNRP